MANEPNQPAPADGDGTLARLKAARRDAGSVFSGGAVFGETPIEVTEPAPPPAEDEEGDDDEPPLEPRVRHAAISAALKAGVLACCAGVFMGFVLMCALGGLAGGWGLFLGLLVMGIAAPVAVLAAVGSYRQALETERHKVGLCPRCGYDLRGSTGARCPECGWRIVSPGSTRAPWTEEEQRASENAE